MKYLLVFLLSSSAFGAVDRQNYFKTLPHGPGICNFIEKNRDKFSFMPIACNRKPISCRILLITITCRVQSEIKEIPFERKILNEIKD